MNRHNKCSQRRSCRAAGIASAACAFAMAAAPPAAGQSGPGTIGEWNAPPGGDDWDDFTPMFSAMLPDGNILFWWQTDGCGTVPERTWNPRTGDFTNISSDGTDHARCSGYVHLSTGSILSAGGVYSVSSDQATEYSYSGNEWVSRATLDIGRFYPSCTRLAAGGVLCTLGDNPPNTETYVDVPEVYDPDTDSWTTLTSAEHPVGGLALYPQMYMLPFDDLVFQAGPNTGTYLLDLDAEEWDDTALGDPEGYGAFSARTAMIEPGVILKCGGAAGGIGVSLPVADTLLIDFADFPTSTPAWLHIDEDEEVYKMLIPRQLHNLVLLPGGRALAVNGIWRDDTEDPYEYVKTPEWIDTNDFGAGWKDLADETYDRGDGPHYLAMLLPSGKVLVCGGGEPDPETHNADKAEIFSPPYLFKANNDPADRPIIGSAAQRVTYGSEFDVNLAQSSPVLATEISMVSLMGLPAVTHGFDQNQRHISLAFEDGGDYALKVTAPADGNIAPPGYYMLFLVSDDGAPSEAVFIQFGPE